jgi:hypothetical protein
VNLAGGENELIRDTIKSNETEAKVIEADGNKSKMANLDGKRLIAKASQMASKTARMIHTQMAT